ncbi:MAG: D-alanyl-D-alanine carboxypeptidase family protein [Oscillospiraceae bacterium]|nr:D-alanyl-D-alanine carboxypeptidase family protein [Oscillospiraceae bacterium]
MQEKSGAKHKYQKTKTKPKGLYSTKDKEYVFGDNTVRKKGTAVKVLFVILPILMVSVLGGGILLGYYSYIGNNNDEHAKPEVNNSYISVEQQKSLYRVVSVSNPIDRSYVPDTIEYQGVDIAEIIQQPLQDMIEGGKKAGVNLIVVKGYVSFDEQHVAYRKYVNSLVSTGKYTQVKAESVANRRVGDSGNSERQLGLSVEFACNSKKDFNTTEEYKWLLKYGAEFGFMQRYTDKSEQLSLMDKDYTLWRYIGKDNALLARKLGLNFDELVEYLQN